MYVPVLENIKMENFLFVPNICQGPKQLHLRWQFSVSFHFAGEIVNLSLDKTTDANFRGFIIQARDAEENPIGSFQFEDDSVSQMTCGEGIHNSITHRNPDEKTGMHAYSDPNVNIPFPKLFNIYFYFTNWLTVYKTLRPPKLQLFPTSFPQKH